MDDPSVFRMYDIRGVAFEQVTEGLAYRAGRSLGTRIRRAGGTTAAIARDVRKSSPRLAEEAARGLSECGLSVFDLGVAPTPVLYYALHRRGLGGGIVATGSHNPKRDNGLKLCLGTAPLFGDQVASLREQGIARDWESGTGAIVPGDIRDEYLQDLASRFRFKSPLRVAIDTGNGVMGPWVLDMFGRLGIETFAIYTEQDGDFPNHLPDPEVSALMRDLSRTVVENRCACGLGFDGDGDRVGVLDETGRKISADWLVALFARDVLQRYPGSVIRFDVKCSDFLALDIRAAGGVPVMGETGHSLLKRDVLALNAALGGELSGHIVFNRDYLPIDDSLYAALEFLKILDRSGGAASALFDSFPRVAATGEIKLPCSDDSKFAVVQGLSEYFRREFHVVDIDGARVKFDGGWFLVRASNTAPNLTARLEAGSKDQLALGRDILLSGLARFPAVDADPLRQTEELA